MSVLKMILADDEYFLSGTLHGSDAQLVYATCACTPSTLKELDHLLQKTNKDKNLKQLFNFTEGLELEPVDAGLIIIDLAKKWIYAQDTYFGSHRSSHYQSPESTEFSITYQFSDDWQFVFEAKWFRYLLSSEVKPFFKFYDDSKSREQAVMDNSKIGSNSDSEFFESDKNDLWTEELSSLHVVYANKRCSLVDLKPADEMEKRDLYIVELIIDYDERAEIAEYRIEVSQDKIAALSIELQAVENLWRRNNGHRWEHKKKALQACVEQERKIIFRYQEIKSEAEQMSMELRNLLGTEKFRALVKSWQDEKEG